MERAGTNRFAGLSGFALKRIAVVGMLIDHFGGVVMDGVIAPYRVNGSVVFTAAMPFMVRYAYLIREVCNTIGYIAFPLFCFLIAEGFTHTRDRVKYGLRLGLFALLSEIPYNLAHYQTLFCFRLQNVMFTLCVGAFTLLAISRAEKRFADRRRAKALCTALITAAGMGLAYLIRSEYVFLGVLSICLLYLLRDQGRLRLLGFAPLLIVSPWILLALPPAMLYNGQRGKGMKYFFYVFYPAHLLAFAAIAWLLSNRVV